MAELQVGAGDHRYEVAEGWGELPPGVVLVEVAGMVTDSLGQVHVFNRGTDPVVVFSRDGRFLRSWGHGVFARPHGITAGPGDTLYLTDDLDQTVRWFTLTGTQLGVLGVSGQKSDTGAVDVDYRTIRQVGPPFNMPTNAALGPHGDRYISDGYGNARVHRFGPEGNLISSWGAPGAGPGEFHLPHGIAVHEDGRVFVADRENDRIQIFDPDGNYLEEWTQIARPCEVYIDADGAVYVAELGYRAGMFPGTVAPSPSSPGGRVSIFDPTGKLLSRWGGGDRPTEPGDFFAPHDVWVDDAGDLYVGEVCWSGGGKVGMVPADCHCLQKFLRIRK